MVGAAGIVCADARDLGPAQRRAWLAQPRVGIPAAPAGRRLLRSCPILVASWALGGLYLSLGPSVAATLFGLHSHLVGGLVVTLLCGTGAATAFGLRARDTDQVLGLAASLLAAGMIVTLAGVEAEVAVLAGAGTLIAGVGFGASALGCFGTLGTARGPRRARRAVRRRLRHRRTSPSASRRSLAGFASTSVGLHTTAVVYGVAVVALSLAALAGRRVLAERRRVPELCG